MGIIDAKKYTLHCDACKLEESAKIFDKGSVWGGSSWQSDVQFKNFFTEWSGGGSAEPELIKATCNKCGKNPATKSGYVGA